jgi:hypothetical protein
MNVVESRQDYNRDGGVESIWLAVAGTALNERGGGLNQNRGHQSFMPLGLYRPAIQPIHRSEISCWRTEI